MRRPRASLPVAKIEKSESEWRQELTPAQFEITREAGTDPAFASPYWDEKGEGTYRCICCDRRAVFFGYQVRLRHRLAELQRAGQP